MPLVRASIPDQHPPCLTGSKSQARRCRKVSRGRGRCWRLKLTAERLHLPAAWDQSPDVSLCGPRSGPGSWGMNEALCSSTAGRGTWGSASGGVPQPAAAACCSLSPSKATGPFGEAARPQPPQPWHSRDSWLLPQALTLPVGQEPRTQQSEHPPLQHTPGKPLTAPLVLACKANPVLSTHSTGGTRDPHPQRAEPAHPGTPPSCPAQPPAALMELLARLQSSKGK